MAKGVGFEPTGYSNLASVLQVASGRVTIAPTTDLESVHWRLLTTVRRTVSGLSIHSCRDLANPLKKTFWLKLVIA